MTTEVSWIIAHVACFSVFHIFLTLHCCPTYLISAYFPYRSLPFHGLYRHAGADWHRAFWQCPMGWSENYNEICRPPHGRHIIIIIIIKFSLIRTRTIPSVTDTGGIYKINA